MRKLLPLVLLFALAACDSGGSDIATATSTVTVAYEGRLQDGTVFDSNSNATFNLAGTIPGFRNNVAGMVVGEMKTFDVAPEDGYGNNPRPGIPANSTLTFDVTLLDVR